MSRFCICLYASNNHLYRSTVRMSVCAQTINSHAQDSTELEVSGGGGDDTSKGGKRRATSAVAAAAAIAAAAVASDSVSAASESASKRRKTGASVSFAPSSSPSPPPPPATPLALYTFHHANFLNVFVRARVAEYVSARVCADREHIGAQMVVFHVDFSSASTVLRCTCHLKSSPPSVSFVLRNVFFCFHSQRCMNNDFVLRQVALVVLMMDAYAARGWNIMKPRAMSIGMIMTLLPNSPLEGLSLIALTELLLELHHDSLAVPLLLQREMQAGPAGYAVNVAGIIDDTRLCCAKSVVRERFGIEAARVFQILLERKMLEEKQIQEMALIQKRAARECLHRMLVADFVRIQEVPKGAGGAADRVPARTCYLFYVPLDEVYLGLLDSYYFAWSNLKAHAAAAAAATRATFEKEAKFRNDADRAKIDAYQRAANQLELAMLRLDESIMLFRDM